ncbi:MAG: hypothetical protein M0D55_14585 [Elusimicrobiota bacterium]|nr:MAG: hypothetical protein M0D55_14585 [Elusimicrobiota bacterium]
MLQARFLSRLVIRGQPADREVVADAVDGILKTKLGQELARQFVLEGAKAEVVLAPLDGATTSYKDGVTTVSGTQGSTSVDKEPPVVTLSRAYLHAEPGWRRVSMAGTLGHELFGHAFEQQRAKKAGIHRAAEYHYRGDEFGSRLIDWTIQTQLNWTNVDGDPGAYLEDPEGYARNLWAHSGYYVQTLSAEEMRNPMDTLKARRSGLTEALAKTREGIKDMEEWTPIIAHFKTVHKLDPRRLVDAEQEVREYLEWARGHIVDIGDSRKALEARISFWETPAGARERDAIVRAAGSSYIRAFESRLKKRALDLSRLRSAGRGPASGPAMVLPGLVIAVPKTGELPPEPVSLRELGALYRQDKKDNPKHWETKK